MLGYLAEQEGGIFGSVLEVEHRFAVVFHVGCAVVLSIWRIWNQTQGLSSMTFGGF